MKDNVKSILKNGMVMSMTEKNCSDDFENATVQGLLFAHELGFKIITEDNKSLNELLEELIESNGDVE